MADLSLDVSKRLPGIGLVQPSVQIFGGNAKLDNEIVRKVFWLCFTTFFAPQPEQGGLIVPHDDPSVRAADEIAAVPSRCPHRLCHLFLRGSKWRLLMGKCMFHSIWN